MRRWSIVSFGKKIKRLMEWRDKGIIISSRRFGENSLIVKILTAENGFYSGFTRQTRGVVQTGNFVSAHWRARLAEHMGYIKCEMIRSFNIFSQDKILFLFSACALIESTVPERQPERQTQKTLYKDLYELIENICKEEAFVSYALWEYNLLSRLGFGLDLTICALTGSDKDITHVSPITGKAASFEACKTWHKKLIEAPPFLVAYAQKGEIRKKIDKKEIGKSLMLTGFFLRNKIFNQDNYKMPYQRDILMEKLEQ